ncbi:MAG: CHASE3 domain-containing protein [Nitrososphaerota archaeon]|nr:CHASE3 domain-containing protein [Nitrososphaerota archaeon]
MTKDWTFGRRIAAGFSLMVLLTVAVGIMSALTLNQVISSSNRVINVNSRLLIDAQSMRADMGEASAAARGFLLTGYQSYLQDRIAQDQAFSSEVNNLVSKISNVTEHRLLNTIIQDESKKHAAIDSVIQLKGTGASSSITGRAYASRVDPLYNKVKSDISSFVSYEQQLLTSARQSSSNTASRATNVILLIVVVSVVIAVVLAYVLARTLRRQVGTAVGAVRSSSSELQASAGQQASAAKEQATAMSEISTTLTELLATSRQIAESAQRVSQVAEKTAGAGREGENIVDKAKDTMADIRRQVDVIVDHSLALGEKSQQIGIVLDIVTELSEQTNILAINSTIEAAGAGESGKRFAVVADEIRKLADRVSDSTKEIRSLIDVVRGAVNTTVMATEIGSKAVDAGSEQFADAARAFGEISSLVTTTTEAAREIELSTKQQTTAVEQVNIAIGDVAQSTRETETSSVQTLQTASQLSNLSRDLMKLVELQGTEVG